MIFPVRLLRPFCPRVVLVSILTCCAPGLLLSCESSFGQATTSLIHSADTKNVDSIDLSTLNVTLNIPVFHKPGRGLDLGLSLTHNNLIWARDLSTTAIPLAGSYRRRRMAGFLLLAMSALSSTTQMSQVAAMVAASKWNITTSCI